MHLLSESELRWLSTGAVFLLISVVLLGAVAGRPPQGSDKTKDSSGSKPAVPTVPSKPPPLEIDDAEPLRLDSAETPASSASKAGADNSACFVCHANMKKESLAATHASNAVGCTSCHGKSIAHRNDEANVIPPDIMFAHESIDTSCSRCHEGHDVEPRAVIQRFLEKSPKLTDAKNLVCTTCHGEHHLPVRTIRWDRKSGKLVSSGKP